eukprot:3473117-Lingulodinium_polyedra.AAC.1
MRFGGAKRLQFIARAKYIEGLDDSAAAAKWASDLDDTRVMKRGSGDDLEMAVSEPLRTQAMRGQTMSNE